MYLERMDVQGFKTFAKKTTLTFPAPKGEHNALTVVVGPNGSGKSNLADAIRWCLGEQSMKLLRGKKSEDIIFSGSEGKARSGFAEVSLTFNNKDKAMSVDYEEVTIARRMYRKGDAEYMVNGTAVRLSDIQLLLAESGVGQRSYSVIGQGMIDHVLTATPEERKIFFDDATGVRGFQMKRHQALLKLQKSIENLTDVERVLAELEPRLNLLRRQVKRLSEREKVEAELRETSAAYYGTLWWNLTDEKTSIEKRVNDAKTKVEGKRAELNRCDEKLLALEKESGDRGGEGGAIRVLQDAYKAAQNELSVARQAFADAERAVELAKVRSEVAWSPLPIASIIDEVIAITGRHRELIARLRGVTVLGELRDIIDALETIFTRSEKLKERLVKPAPKDVMADPALAKAREDAEKNVRVAETNVKMAEGAMDAKAKEKTTVKSEVFDVQRTMRTLQHELSSFEASMNALAIDAARVDTRLDGLASEMRDAHVDKKSVTDAPPKERIRETDELHEKIQRLRHTLELIGGIDEEVVKEHKETDERFAFLSTNVADLRAAITSTEHIIDELDEQIALQSESAFKTIDAEFQKYFKVLFGGGRCSLVKMTEEEIADETKLALDRAMEDVAEEKGKEDDELAALHSMLKTRKDAVLGIDIQATPPGKKLKALNLLSGGERALTAIALVSAIMATNPSPFVVLDEVDAALDEANTVRFANILHELRQHTQFIVITHNRATMEKADVLYGVTMGDDGVSDLLSVKLEDIEANGSARR